jgi:hypothetical protein
MAKFKYLEIIATNKNCIHEEMKSKLNLGNVCYHSVQSLLSSPVLSKNLNIKTYKTITLPVVLYWCETWSLTLREKLRMRVFENRVKREEVVGSWRRLHNEEFHNLYTLPYVIQEIKSRRMRWMGHTACMGKMRNAYNISV